MTKTEEMEACPLAEFGARPCTSNSDYVVIHLLPKNGETVKYRLSVGGAALLADELRGSIRRPTLPEGLVEQIAQTIHAYCSRNMIMTYLAAEEDCEGLARAIVATLSPASHDPYEGNAAREGMMDDPASHDSRLAAELEELSEKAFSPNKRDWYLPWRVVPEGGKPTIAGSHSGNLFRGFIGTWQDADLVVALVNNLPAILAALRMAPAPDALRESDLAACERAIDRMGWDEIRAFMNEPGQSPSEDAGGYLLRKIKALFGIKPDRLETYRAAARRLVAEARTEGKPS